MKKKFGNFLDFELFVGDVIMRIGLCLFGTLHLTLGPNRKWEHFCFFKKKLGENPHL